MVPRETGLRQFKIKNKIFKKNTTNVFENVENTKENQRCSALSDLFYRKPHKEIIGMRSFSTWRFGLRGRTRSIFRKELFEISEIQEPKIPKLLEMDAGPPF